MSRTFLCIRCNVEFPTSALYQTHKLSGHKLHLDKATPLGDVPEPTRPPGMDLPAGVPVSALPSPEFMETMKQIEEKNKQQTTPPSQHPTELPVSEPIKLTYKYIGECGEHRVAIETLEIDVADTHFCIAFCPVGKHQVKTKEVAKI